MSEKYAITGLGLHNPLGSNTETSWRGLLAGNTGIRQISWDANTDPTRFPPSMSFLKTRIAAINLVDEAERLAVFGRDWTDWDNNTRAAMLAVNQAILDSSISPLNCGVIVSSVGAGTTVRSELNAAMMNGLKRFSPRKTINAGIDYPAAQVASVYHAGGPNLSVISSCTTGVAAIDSAIAMLKHRPDLDGVIVGCSDHTADPVHMYWFQNLNALCTSDDPTASRPFDQSRSGFVMGEGAASVIVEPLSKAIARGAHVYATIEACFLSTVHDSDTSPDSAGHGAIDCMSRALDQAQVLGTQISLVNAHATSTVVGDQVEYNAILTTCPQAVVVANKGQIGHQMAAAGLTETIYTLLAMRDNVVPPNPHLTSPIGTELIIPTACTPVTIEYALKNSFGFGGRNACIIFKRFHNYKG